MNAEPPRQTPGLRPLRFVVFGASIVSEWGNPAATTTRAVLRALVVAGHDAVFLEQRGNRPTVELLRARGAGALRAFAARYPTVQYRTYDIPHGSDRAVWPGREVATADAVIVQDTAPPEVIDTIAALANRQLVRFLQVTQPTPPANDGRFDHVLAPMDPVVASRDGVTPFGPAVEETVLLREAGSGGVIVVAYDNSDAAARIAAALATDGPVLVTPGAVGADGFRYVPEVELASLYRAADVAVVVAGDASPLATARVLLPLSFGCASLVVAGEGMPPVPADGSVVAVALEHLGAAVRSRRRRSGSSTGPTVPLRYTGADHAERLAALVKEIQRRRG